MTGPELRRTEPVVDPGARRQAAVAAPPLALCTVVTGVCGVVVDQAGVRQAAVLLCVATALVLLLVVLADPSVPLDPAGRWDLGWAAVRGSFSLAAVTTLAGVVLTSAGRVTRGLGLVALPVGAVWLLAVTWHSSRHGREGGT